MSSSQTDLWSSQFMLYGMLLFVSAPLWGMFMLELYSQQGKALDMSNYLVLCSMAVFAYGLLYEQINDRLAVIMQKSGIKEP